MNHPLDYLAWALQIYRGRWKTKRVGVHSRLDDSAAACSDFSLRHATWVWGSLPAIAT